MLRLEGRRLRSDDAPPLLVPGMYDHSYHMDFGAAAGRYVDAFMANVNWDEVSRRAEWARKSARV